MRYANIGSGKATSSLSNADRNPSKGDFVSFHDVEERLVDAMTYWRRAPDRERGWLQVRSYWPEIRRSEFIRVVAGEIDWPEPEQDLRPLPLTRAEVAVMMEASDWLQFVPERDRRLVALVARQLAAGGDKVSWTRIKRQLGIALGTDGLRMRYSRAITVIARELEKRQKSARIGCQAG